MAAGEAASGIEDALAALEAARALEGRDDLARLRRLGMDTAEVIGRKAKGEASRAELDGLGGPDVALGFSRVARGVRQIVAIEDELRNKGELKKERTKRNARTAEALRLRLGGIVRNRLPQIDREYLKGLLADLFSDYDDYDDIDLADDVRPMIARISARLGVDYDPGIWPEAAKGIRIGDELLDYHERDEELDARIMAELDRIAAAKEAQRAEEEARERGPP